MGRKLTALFLSLCILSTVFGSVDVYAEGETAVPSVPATEEGLTEEMPGILDALAGAVEIHPDVTYGQTEARKMLSMINAFRTGEDAWQYDESGNKKKVTGLKNLTYNYEIEQAAMQRAAEIALRFTHTRPDGSNAFSAYPNFQPRGENMAAGAGGQMDIAAEAFAAWREDNADYSGQGHRRSILSPNFTAVGVGHAILNGVHYWVLAFGTTDAATTQTAALDGVRRITIKVDPQVITKAVASATTSELSLPYQSKKELTEFVTVDYQTAETWPAGSSVTDASPKITAKSDAPDIAAVSGTTATGMKIGKTTLHIMAATSAGDKEVVLPVNVGPLDISDPLVSAAAVADVDYNGKPQTPEPVLTLNGTKLKKGTDYSLSYSANRNAGTAKITVTGAGNFTGTRQITFTIRKIACKISVTCADTEYGAKIKPKVTAPDDGKITYSYHTGDGKWKNGLPSAVGTYTLRALLSGAVNYKDASAETKMKIVPSDISKAEVEFTSRTVYTGSPVTPEFAVTKDGKTLKSGTDFTFTLADNTAVGTATLTLTGKGGYKGTKKVTFEIREPGVEMYRVYNPNSGEHFYTANASEKDMLAGIGWNYEGIGWYAPVHSETPVYRLYNQYGGEHHYTMNAAERDMLTSVGWTYEGIGWYSDDKTSVPLYREYNPNQESCNHNYTTRRAEHDYLVSIGWRDEGIAWYGIE